ncbi:carboxylesterase 1-like [Quercus lobata]|uniref:Alpha/beta hydrolase fold-3 domain-containing protein n=1 Tax=Quercus lobata TaxID=97700 RepID=A0A7N2N6A1_QUELO|nr:carboxylesterase 1-like [Quercus lobata]
MSGQTPPSNPTTTDPYQYLQIVNNSDGTITRHRKIPNTPATPDPDHPTPVLSKDIPLNQSNKTWVRIFLPKQALNNPSSSKLPLIVYFHGGGFILYSASSTVFHDFCSNIAIDVNAIIVSVDYRLAPEHRLPAAYDDAVETLHFIKTNQDEWLTKYADFSNTSIMGSSAGGNVAYHAALREADQIENLEPLIIRGLVLHQPYFGGTQRTESELKLANDPVLPLPLFVNDLMWELSLPIAVDRDHEYCNPTVGGGSQRLEKIRLLGWRVLVIDCKGDPLIDRQIELVKMMEEKGVVVVSQFDEGGHHGVDLQDLSRAKALNVVLKNFMLTS